MGDEQEKSSGFRVTDRRRFTESGAERDAAAGPESGRPDPSASPEPPTPVTFSTFVLGLSTQALLLLGEIPNPQTGEQERDLAEAKQVIDILGVLKAKTLNNLEQAEEGLLDSVLYDLRIRYVELVRGPQKEEA
jgi:uncharacterized protein DUF1844